MGSFASSSDAAQEDRGITPALAVLSGIFVSYYLIIAVLRMGHPFELEWMEGGTLVNAARILNGAGIYVRPSPEYAPYFYTPFYYYLCAWVSALIGEGFFVPRLLSLFFSLGCMGWLFVITRRIAQSVNAGVIAVGMFGSAYWATGQWYDLGRVDSMFLFFLLGATHCILHFAGWKSAVSAAIFAAAAYFTKQTAAAVAVWLFAIAIVRGGPRRGLLFGSVLLLVILSLSALFNGLTEGWYGYVTRKLMLNQHILPASIFTFWTHDVLLRLPVCAGFAVMLLGRLGRLGDRRSAWTLFLLAAGFVGSSWLSRINIGGFRNVLIPAVAFSSIALGWAVAEFCRPVVGRAGVVGTMRARLALGLVAAQFLWLQVDVPRRAWANPWACIPSRADREAGEMLLRTLAGIEGDVLLPNHPYLLLLIHKKPCAHTAGVDDVIRGGNDAVEQALVGEIRRRIQAGEYAAIILEREWVFRRDTERHYRRHAALFSRDDVFWPVTGWRTRPEEIWIPNRSGLNSIESASKTP